MDTLTQAFEDRLQEVEAFLELLAALERQVREGPPKIGGATITAQQQKILYSSVYLQLYNLVEATANWCIDTVAAAAANSGRWHPGDLTPNLRREWVRFTARTHKPLNEDSRLAAAVDFCDRLIQSLPVSKWSMERGGGGNWDDRELKAITSRIGFTLHVSLPVYTGIKQKMREDLGAMALVKDLRNRLAHGSISFAECGGDVTVSELQDIKDRVARYLREVVQAFRGYIDRYEFLVPAKRPAVGSQP